MANFGGVILWERHISRQKAESGGSVQGGSNQQLSEARANTVNLINELVREVFLEDRFGLKEYTIKSSKLKWSLENDHQLYAVGVASKFATFYSVDAFLKEVSSAFVNQFPTARRLMGLSSVETAAFDRTFDAFLEKFMRSEETHDTHLSEDAFDEEEGEESVEELEKASLSGGKEGDGNTASTVDNDSSEVTKQGHVLVTKGGRRLAGRHRGAGRTAEGTADERCTGEAGESTKKKKKPTKAPTRWDRVPGGVVDEVAEEQAATKTVALTKEEQDAQTEMQRAVYIKRLANGKVAPVQERNWGEEPSSGRVASFLRSYVGGSRDLQQSDIEKVIPGLREKLIGKNVSLEVAENVCRSVEASVKGRKLGTFESIFSVIDNALVASLRRILQPKNEINILRDVGAAKAMKKPYVIVLCGVNGVGKSTSLAKIAYWLQQNGLSVLIAAGDTFRHGAVEQLQVHGRCLGVEVFQQGYGSDPSGVAAAAISTAARKHIDVVLVDTAGRQQNHASRMRALAKLMHDNQPDLVLFVGEALVGNNGVDQLRRFNQCLVDYAPIGSACRGIDGIVLTKFDTMDDKVGAAVSMVYELGQPIVFVGVGQTYQDLKVMEPDVVVSALMK